MLNAAERTQALPAHDDVGSRAELAGAEVARHIRSAERQGTKISVPCAKSDEARERIPKNSTDLRLGEVPAEASGDETTCLGSFDEYVQSLPTPRGGLIKPRVVCWQRSLSCSPQASRAGFGAWPDVVLATI